MIGHINNKRRASVSDSIETVWMNCAIKCGRKRVGTGYTPDGCSNNLLKRVVCKDCIAYFANFGESNSTAI
jgi:hypothetical protein